MIAFHTLPQSATHTRGFSGWLMATLIIQFSHSGLHYLNSFPNLGGVHFSTEALRQTVFSKDGHGDRSHSTWSHSVTLTQTRPTSSAGPFPSSSRLEHRETLVTTSDNRTWCDDALWFLTQIITLPGSSALLSWILILGIHLLCCPWAQEPHRDPPNSPVSKEFMMSL